MARVGGEGGIVSHIGASDAFILRCLRSERFVVSADGVVMNMSYRGTGVPRMVATRESPSGYLACFMSADGESRHVRVHRVVAIAIHGPPPSSAWEVDHLDGDKRNNRPGNLQWVTRRENHNRAVAMGNKAALRGEELSIAAVLTAEQAREVHRLRSCGMLQREIGARFGITQSGVSVILRGKTWPSIYREFHP